MCTMMWCCCGYEAAAPHNTEAQCSYTRRGAEHTACTEPSTDTWNGTAQLASTTTQRRGALVDVTQNFTGASTWCSAIGEWCMESAQVLSSTLANAYPPDSSTGPGT